LQYAQGGKQHWYEKDNGLLKIRLTESVHHLNGRILLPKGSLLEARIGLYGTLEVEVADSRYLPLRPDQWELVLTDEDLERLLEA
jgi:hypothetical protein